MRAPQIYTKFDQDLLFQIRISARAGKIDDMAVRQRRNAQTPPPRDLPGRGAAVALDRGRKTTGEGRGRPKEREGKPRSGAWASGPMGNREESCEGAEGAIWCGQGRFF